MSSMKWLVAEHVRQVFKERAISILNSPLLHLKHTGIDLPPSTQWKKTKTMLFYELQSLTADLTNVNLNPNDLVGELDTDLGQKST
jgi:hypothetical protein